MRFLRRPSRPADLTDTRVADLTSEFLRDPSKAVWKKPFIEAALLAMSHNKCAYCEARLGMQSMYLEVDHFSHKGKYPNKVVDWSNLVPSCKHCNTSKGDHDVEEQPIIDPTAVDPRSHMRLFNYRFRGLDEVGRSTIDVLDLNDRGRNVEIRFNVGETIHQGVSSLHRDLERFERSPTIPMRNRALGTLRQLLREAGPASVYGSTAATILFLDPDFIDMKQKIEALDFWDTELEALYQSGRSIAYLRAHGHGGAERDGKAASP